MSVCGPDTADSCPTLCPITANALCPKCLSLERHRLLWLYLTRETDLLTSFPRTLHIAPEVCIMRHLKPHFKGIRTVRHRRPRKPAGRPALRRATDSAGRRFGRRDPLQPPARTRRRRPQALHELYRILKPAAGHPLSPVNRTTNRPTRTTRSPIPKSDTHLRTIRPPPHLRRGLHRPLREAGFEPRTSTTPRPSPSRTPALRPAERPYLRRLQALRQTGMRSLRVSTKTPRNSVSGVFPLLPVSTQYRKNTIPVKWAATPIDQQVPDHVW